MGVNLHLPHHVPHPHIDPDTREILALLAVAALVMLSAAALGYWITSAMGALP